MKITDIRFPHSLKVGDMILCQRSNEIISLGTITEFLTSEDGYPFADIKLHENSQSLFVKLKDLTQNSLFMLVIP
jgi:hypothetical protein